MSDENLLSEPEFTAAVEMLRRWKCCDGCCRKRSSIGSNRVVLRPSTPRLAGDFARQAAESSASGRGVWSQLALKDNHEVALFLNECVYRHLQKNPEGLFHS